MKAHHILTLDPLTQMRLTRFKQIKRGYWSYKIMLALIIISLLAEVLVNSRALVVSYEGKLYFPTYSHVYLGKQFGLDYNYEANYRQLQQELKSNGKGWVVLPPVPYNPYEQDLKDGVYPPYAPSVSAKHFLGTDGIGRDILARLLYGFRIAIFFSLFYVAITYTIGVIVGCLMGYWGGVFDILFQRLIEIWEQIPFLYVVMIVASIFKPDFGIFLLIFVFFGWTAQTWSTRAMTYRERERDYVLAARSMGASTWRIVNVHIIPNVLVVIVTTLPFAISGGISSLTSLDYLGFGLRPPTPSWGELLSEGVSQYSTSPWILTSVVTALTVVLVLISFVGEALRESFDSKKFTVYK
jgi:microcin C transport system permease protein